MSTEAAPLQTFELLDTKCEAVMLAMCDIAVWKSASIRFEREKVSERGRVSRSWAEDQ